MGKLNNKIALVTDAARGQGEAEARLFAAEGATVILADVLDGEGAAVARDIGDAAAYYHLDVPNETQWQRLADEIGRRYGHLNVLVNKVFVPRFR